MILQVPVMNKGPITPLMGVILTTYVRPGMLQVVPGFSSDFHDDWTSTFGASQLHQASQPSQAMG